MQGINKIYTTMLLLVVALFFLRGEVLIIGIGEETFDIPFPQSVILAYFAFGVAITWLIPTWMVARLSKWIRKRFRQSTIGENLRKAIKRNEKLHPLP